MRRFVLAVAAASLIGPSLAAQNPPPPTPAQIEAGRKVYASNKCATCHSIAGVGSKVSPLDGVGTKLTAEEIRQWITDPDPMTAKLKTKPKVRMKKYVLKDPDLEALIAFIRSLTK
jgi:mono/diheme cytochrome c family protein